MAASNNSVRYTTGVPVVGDFSSSEGSPIVINSLTSIPYYLSPAGVVTAVRIADLRGELKNKLLNENFSMNQLGVTGAVVLAAGVYGHDMWKAGASGCSYTFSTVNNLTTLTITAGSLLQVIEGDTLQSGTYALSWTGTAQGKVGAGSFGVSGSTGTAVGGTNLSIEFGTGTLSLPQLESGDQSTLTLPLHPTLTRLLCHRHYFQSWGSGGFTPAGTPYCGMPIPNALTIALGSAKFSVTMRAIPTVYLRDDIGALGKVSQPGLANGIAAAAGNIGVDGFATMTAGVNYTVGYPVRSYYIADARI